MDNGSRTNFELNWIPKKEKEIKSLALIILFDKTSLFKVIGSDERITHHFEYHEPNTLTDLQDSTDRVQFAVIASSAKGVSVCHQLCCQKPITHL